MFVDAVTFSRGSQKGILDMEIGEELVASEIAKYMSHLHFSRGNKAWMVEGKMTAVLVRHVHRGGEKIADEAFSYKIHEGRHCKGGCTQGGTSTDSASSFVGPVKTGIISCSGAGGKGEK